MLRPVLVLRWLLGFCVLILKAAGRLDHKRLVEFAVRISQKGEMCGVTFSCFFLFQVSVTAACKSIFDVDREGSRCNGL